MPLDQSLLGFEEGAPRPEVWAEKAPAKLSPQLFLKAARIAAQQVYSKHEITAGLVHWPMEGVEQAADRQTDIFHGPPGIALFLAAFAAVNDEPDCRALALQALNGSRELTARHLNGTASEDSNLRWQVGGFTGLGSICYALSRAGKLLQEPSLEKHALELFLGINTLAIEQDQHFDVTFGSAGTLLVSLLLHDDLSSQDPRRDELLKLANTCGRHLLANRVAHEEKRAWSVNPGTLPSSGFAHGAAGIAVALSRLAAASGDSEYWQAAREALAYEASLFDAEIGNWYGEPGDTAHPIGWCYGAAGIALARMAVRRTSEVARRDETLNAELDTALNTCWRGTRPVLDHLCCGSMARAEALIVSALEHGAPQDFAAAATIGSFALRATKAAGGFRVSSDADYEPSLLHGLAGIGYTFLRLAAPDQLPSLVLLD